MTADILTNTMAAAQARATPLDAPNQDPHAGTKYDFPRDLVGYGRHPPNAQWPGGAKIAVSFVINYEEASLSIRSAIPGSADMDLGCRAYRPERR